MALAPLATLLTPTSAGHADVPSDTLTGLVLLPDGHTPAPAAAIDLSLDRTSPPFARAVSDASGLFAVTIHTTTERLALANAQGGTLSLVVTINKLVPSIGGDVHPPNLVKTVRDVETFVKNTIDSTGQPVAHLLARQPDLGTLVTAAVSIASAASVFKDPDLVTGHDDLNDPDVIPPLLSDVEVFTMDDPGATSNPDGLSVDDVVSGVRPSDMLRQATGSDGGGGTTSDGCTLAKDFYDPKPGGKQPIEGVDFSTTLSLYKCKQETDKDNDYWAWGEKGWVDAHDVSHGSGANPTTYSIYRFKFRFSTKDQTDAWLYRSIDPDQDTPYHNQATPVNWSVGFDYVVTGSISGSFVGDGDAKQKVYATDSARKLYHASWLARHGGDLAYASRDTLWNGGGITWRVPQGTTTSQMIANSLNQTYIYRCWYTNTYYDAGCD